MHVLVCAYGWYGHLHPLVGVAQWLTRLGHRISLLDNGIPPRYFAAMGAERLALPEDIVAAAESEEVRRMVPDPDPDLERRLSDPAMVRQGQRQALAMYGAIMDPFRAMVRKLAPDAILTEGEVYVALVAAQLEKIPCLCVGSGLEYVAPPHFAFPQELMGLPSLGPERQAFFARYGLEGEFREACCVSPAGNIVFTTEALVGPAPPRTHLVGPSIPPEPRGDEPDDFPWTSLRPDGRVVYASFGSVLDPVHLLRPIAEAAVELDAQLVVTSKKAALGADLPGHPLIVPYAPQLRLLEKVAAFVTHGGANSVTEALYHGVPMLLLPLCNDQWLQAYFLQKARAGIAIEDPGSRTTAEIRKALAQLLAPESAFRDNARRVQTSFRQRDGAREAARLIERVAAKATSGG